MGGHCACLTPCTAGSWPSAHCCRRRCERAPGRHRYHHHQQLNTARAAPRPTARAGTPTTAPGRRRWLSTCGGWTRSRQRGRAWPSCWPCWARGPSRRAPAASRALSWCRWRVSLGVLGRMKGLWWVRVVMCVRVRGCAGVRAGVMRGWGGVTVVTRPNQFGCCGERHALGSSAMAEPTCWNGRAGWQAAAAGACPCSPCSPSVRSRQCPPPHRRLRISTHPPTTHPPPCRAGPAAD